MRWLIALAVVVAVAVAATPDGPTAARARSEGRTPPAERTDLRPGLQLAAMRTGIAAAADFFTGADTRCGRTVPVIAYVQGETLAGNFRDDEDGCYVWLNLAQAPLLNAQEICKITLHEMGHLGGRQHSADPDDVMYSPFRSQPIPAACVEPLRASAARRASN